MKKYFNSPFQEQVENKAVGTPPSLSDIKIVNFILFIQGARVEMEAVVVLGEISDS